MNYSIIILNYLFLRKIIVLFLMEIAGSPHCGLVGIEVLVTGWVNNLTSIINSGQNQNECIDI